MRPCRASILVFAFLAASALQTFAASFRLVDGAGRTVEFSRPPQRLVVIGQAPYMALHLLYAFDEGRKRLAGVERKWTSASDFLPLVAASFKKVTELNTNPNVEQVASLNPDLVILKGTTPTKMSETLEKVGIPTFHLAFETPELFLKDIENVGAILGNPKRAQEIISFYRIRLDRIRKNLSGIKESEKPRVLLVEYNKRSGSAAVQVPSKSWMQTIEVLTAGGNPVWFDAVRESNGWTVVNFEQIARWNPDKIFVVVAYDLDPAQVIREIRTDAHWAALKAAEKNEIYIFPRDIFEWDQAEMRWILGMSWLAARIYPDRFKETDMKSEAMAFFIQLYSMKKPDIESEILSKVKLDVRYK
jgi:iron complex transport system substrate-binding protein